jgi:hypothetical protein
MNGDESFIVLFIIVLIAEMGILEFYLNILLALQFGNDGIDLLTDGWA